MARMAALRVSTYRHERVRCSVPTGCEPLVSASSSDRGNDDPPALVTANGDMSTLHFPTVCTPRRRCSITANVQSFSANGARSSLFARKRVQMSERCSPKSVLVFPSLRSVVMAVLLPRVHSTLTPPSSCSGRLTSKRWT